MYTITCSNPAYILEVKGNSRDRIHNVRITTFPHYGDVIMGAIASQLTSLTIVYSTVYSDADKRILKRCVTCLCAGNSPGTGEFPAQMASYAENVSIWWRHNAADVLGTSAVTFDCISISTLMQIHLCDPYRVVFAHILLTCCCFNFAYIHQWLIGPCILAAMSATFASIAYRWLSARLQDLQYVSDDDATVLY